MLILERTLNSELSIGNDIKVRIHRVKGRRVWLAVHAPNNVPVHRDDARRRLPEQPLVSNGGPAATAGKLPAA